MNSLMSQKNKTLIKNPDTPLHVLMELGEYYPNEFLENPVFKLNLLSNPNFLMEIPKKTLISILELPDVPHYFIQFALKHRKERIILAAIIINHPQKEMDLTNAYLRGTDLTGADLTGADLSGADLREADLTGADLSHANLKNVKLHNAHIDKQWFLVWKIINYPERIISLRGDSLFGANLIGANLKNVILIDADLSGADLSNADLRKADLTNTNLSYAKLRGADLSNADLSYANLTDANLSKANLTGADLTGADLRSADLREADLTKTKFTDTLINEETKIDYDIIDNFQVKESGTWITGSSR